VPIPRTLYRHGMFPPLPHTDNMADPLPPYDASRRRLEEGCWCDEDSDSDSDLFCSQSSATVSPPPSIMRSPAAFERKVEEMKPTKR
jgi:hypothetical protein